MNRSGASWLSLAGVYVCVCVSVCVSVWLSMCLLLPRTAVKSLDCDSSHFPESDVSSLSLPFFLFAPACGHVGVAAVSGFIYLQYRSRRATDEYGMEHRCVQCAEAVSIVFGCFSRCSSPCFVILSYCHSVVLSFCRTVILSLCLPVSLSLSVTLFLSFFHSVFLSNDLSLSLFFCFFHSVFVCISLSRSL